MNESLPESDEQLSLKKRARRRLIGAVVFVSFAAVVLPMVMDEEPPPASPNIELNIPAQEKGFVAPNAGVGKATNAAVSTGVAEPVPAVPAAPAAAASVAAAETKAPVEVPAAAVKAEAPTETAKSPLDAKSETKQKALATPPAKAPEIKPAQKPAKPEPTKLVKAEPAKPVADAKRAQSILEGKAADSTPAGDGQHVVLIGAFANSGNVQLLQKKLGEMGLRVYTEPLDTPQGKKTRVRVGPFPSREAANKAVARMKAIGVGGVVAPKS